jgi:uncharacterized protein
MQIFTQNEVNNSQLNEWPDLKELDFVKVLEGNPTHKGTHSFGNFGSSLQIGLWECSPGKFEYTYPGNEICIIEQGTVEIIDSLGNVRRLGPGDSMFTTKGEVVTWNIISNIRKVFMIA